MSIYEPMKVIYDCIQDEESRMIFRQRVMFSLTNQQQYMDAIIEKVSDKQLLKSNNHEAYIFGCGFYGKLVHDFVKKSWISFVDNNPRGGYCGLKVIYPDDLPKEASVYIAVKYHAEEIEAQLINLGISKNNIVNVGRILMELGDRQYFDLRELQHIHNEIFVDAGCLNGISTNNFIKWTKNDYEHVYCFEADSENANLCKEKMNDLIKLGKVTVIDKALFNQNRTLSFISRSNGTSCIGVGEGQVEAVTLDSVLGDKHITFIKMDIEGAEYSALQGAKEIIKKYHPKLAISVYHRPEDILDIPNLILSYSADYKFYLRHYSIFNEETILYAV